MGWPEYVKRLVRGDNQVAVEKRSGVAQSTVSRWLRGVSRPSAAEAAVLAEAYGGNVLEAFVAGGLLTEEQAGMPPRRREAFGEIIDDDPHLSLEAKAHIKAQYGLLRAASANSRGVLREQIQRNTSMDEETRRHLLAALNEEPSPEEEAVDAGVAAVRQRRKVTPKRVISEDREGSA